MCSYYRTHLLITLTRLLDGHRQSSVWSQAVWQRLSSPRRRRGGGRGRSGRPRHAAEGEAQRGAGEQEVPPPERHERVRADLPAVAASADALYTRVGAQWLVLGDVETQPNAQGRELAQPACMGVSARCGARKDLVPQRGKTWSCDSARLVTGGFGVWGLGSTLRYLGSRTHVRAEGWGSGVVTDGGGGDEVGEG